MKYIVAALLLLPTVAVADLVHKWKSPSFSGMGYSAHVLGIEQLQFNRQQDIDDAARAEVPCSLPFTQVKKSSSLNHSSSMFINYEILWCLMSD